MRIVFKHTARLNVIVGTFGQKIQAHNPLPAALAALAARLLERHVEPREQIPFAIRPGDPLGPRKRTLGGEIIHRHQLGLAALAQRFYGVLCGHSGIVILAWSL